MDVILRAFADIFHFVLHAYSMVVLVAVLLTWVNPDPYNPIVRFLRGVTEPVLYRIRRAMPFVVISGIDLSPIVLLLALHFAQAVLPALLFRASYAL